MASRGIGKGRSGGTVVALVALVFVALLLSALSATSETAPIKESSRDLRAPGPIKCRGSDYDFIAPSNCAPAFSVNLKQCTSRMRKCKCQYNVDMKWTGKGCPNTRGEGVSCDGPLPLKSTNTMHVNFSPGLSMYPILWLHVQGRLRQG